MDKIGNEYNGKRCTTGFMREVLSLERLTVILKTAQPNLGLEDTYPGAPFMPGNYFLSLNLDNVPLHKHA